MKNFIKDICTLFITAVILSSCAKVATPYSYYVDAVNGDDNNSGLSAEEAWKTIEKANTIELKPGEQLLFKCGQTFDGILEICGNGNQDSLAIVSCYGEGERPCIVAQDSSLYAVKVYDSDYLTVKNLDIKNHGSEDMPRRTGILVESKPNNTSHNITLDSLYIHDVNGSLVKLIGGGSGILITLPRPEVKPEEKPDTTNGAKPERRHMPKPDTKSNFDHLTIQNCHIVRCQRNAMIWEEYSNRNDWNPSKYTTVRYNLIEEVPGDGIVPICCDSCLVEYNVMRNCPETLPDTEAAAGFWPWSCDNTTLQFNNVSDHKAPWDSQGYDSDYNSTNTTIQYNYSHDNYGGLCLICTPSVNERNIGNIGTRILYNVSINDGLRPHLARGSMFSPSVHFGGPSKDTRFEHNIIHQNVKPAPEIDTRMITLDSWEGFADSVVIAHNLFYAASPSYFDQGKSTNVKFEGNYLVGNFKNAPEPVNEDVAQYYLQTVVARDPTGFKGLAPLFETKTICGEEFQFVNKNTIEEAFKQFEK